MTSRLYRTTQRLYGQVAGTLHAMGVASAVRGNPTTFGLVALYVAGLVLLDARPTQVRISARLPACSHDALNRLLRVMPLSTRALLRGLIGLVRHLSRGLGTPGYLVVDDVVIEKPFAKRLPWAAWTYSFAKQRKVYGCHIVLLAWTSDPAGPWRIPVAFRLWRPKRSCAPERYRKKTELVVTMLREVVAAGCPAACQGWVDQVMVRHVALVCLTFVALQLLRRDPQDTVGAVKAAWHDEILRDGQTPPQPLRAAPTEFRHKLTA